MAFKRTDFALGRDYEFDADWLIAEGLLDCDPAALELSPAEVGALSWPERERRVVMLLNAADLLFYQAGQFARTHCGPREVVAVAGMLSGGNDSTTGVYALRSHLTHLIHADTGVCLAGTRAFAGEVAADLGVPLLVPKSANPDDHYENRVRRFGFPGPALHDETMNRLKERAWREARRQLVTDGRKQRIIQVAGRRRSESRRRTRVPEMQREDSVMWVSPLVYWTRLDLNTYKRMQGAVPAALDGGARYRVTERPRVIPRNPVYDWLHYSGECLCGSKARRGEREHLFASFPGDPAVAKLQGLEAELAGRDDIAPARRIWGCGGTWEGCTSGMCNE